MTAECKRSRVIPAIIKWGEAEIDMAPKMDNEMKFAVCKLDWKVLLSPAPFVYA